MDVSRKTQPYMVVAEAGAATPRNRSSPQTTNGILQNAFMKLSPLQPEPSRLTLSEPLAARPLSERQAQTCLIEHVYNNTKLERAVESCAALRAGCGESVQRLSPGLASP